MGRARLSAVSTSSDTRITVGITPSWATARKAAAASVKELKRHPLVLGDRGYAVHAHRHASDDAERAFGAHHQLAQVGSDGVLG